MTKTSFVIIDNQYIQINNKNHFILLKIFQLHFLSISINNTYNLHFHTLLIQIMSYKYIAICMHMYFVRKIFRPCILPVRWDTHPVSKCSLKIVMQIPIVGPRYNMCTYAHINAYAYTYKLCVCMKICTHA